MNRPQTRQWVDFRPMLSGKHCCDNCGRICDGEDVNPITDFFQRVEPGGTVPSGECQKCGALCYPVKGEKEEKEDADQVSSDGVREQRGGA
jgi:hypothetical protein